MHLKNLHTRRRFLSKKLQDRRDIRKILLVSIFRDIFSANGSQELHFKFTE